MTDLKTKESLAKGLKIQINRGITRDVKTILDKCKEMKFDVVRFRGVDGEDPIDFFVKACRNKTIDRQSDGHNVEEIESMFNLFMCVDGFYG